MTNIEKDFQVSTARMRRIIRDFHDEMDNGLSGKPGPLKMLRTYVKRPTGKEKGKFIALDLGGTNFRILELELKGGRKILPPKVMKFCLRKDDVTGTGDALFDFIAECIKGFLKRQKIEDSMIGLGFTFSFPVNQTAVDSGKLLYWTKGFSASGVVGEDVVLLLKKAFGRNGIANVRVSALANDTVGTLVATGYQDGACDVGVIIGTGTNACYVEESLDGMIVNTEWGNFNLLDRNKYDKSLDARSDNRGKQILEKMVSGMYLGEIVRFVLKNLLKSAAPGKFTAEDISDVLSLSRMRGLGKRDIPLVKKVCGLVAVRAARISAATLAAVVTKMDPGLSRSHTVAIDGSVYEKLPGFSGNVRKALKEIFGSRASRIKISLAKDGSGKGAAIIAAVADKKVPGTSF